MITREIRIVATRIGLGNSGMSSPILMRYNERMATRRYYIPDSEKPAGATDAQVALAEEIIDNYVGFQHKYIRREFDGEITSLLADKKIIDQSNRTFLGGQYRDYYKDCVIEFLSGDHAGELRPIASSQSSDYSITYSGDTLNNLS